MSDDEDEGTLSPALFKKSHKQKNASRSRVLASDALLDEAGESSEVFRPKKSVISRSRINTTQQRSVPDSKSVYSTEYLASLRDSTPTTPQVFPGDGTLPSERDASSALQTLPAAESEAQNNKIVVPEPAQVRSIVAEREIRRRAGENYVPLTDSLSLEHRDRTDIGKRMQTEDEVDLHGGDGTEGLAGYESDILPIGDQRHRRTERAKRDNIQSMIDEVEGTGFLDDSGVPIKNTMESSTDDSDDEWERTQVQKSVAGVAQRMEKEERPNICVPEILPVPTVSQVLAALRTRLETAKSKLEEDSSNLAAIESQQIEIANREEAIKVALQHASLNLETARLKVGGLDVIGGQG